MSVKSCNSVGHSRGEVVRCGLHKKLKTSKKKYFVLRADTPESSACLEYYDSEKKYISGQAPKRSIALKACFNINKLSENQTKYKHVIALYTKDDCFSMVLDNEKELDSWLTALLSLQQGEEAVNGEAPKPTFEHVWKVKVLDRGLGTTGITGNYNLCLTEDKKLSLIKQDSKDVPMVFHLTNVRSCGSLKNYFFLEIGRSSTLGPGGLWMETEDSNIASNIHSTINHLFFNSHSNQELGPKDRKRSSSATESSKPNNTTYRKQNFSLSKSHGISQDNPQSNEQTVSSVSTTSSQHPIGLSSGRERSGSMPSRARTTSEGNHILSNFTRQPATHSYRQYSGMRDISYSPPTGSPVSPPSVGCSTDSTGSSYSLPDEPDGLCPDTEITICYGIPQDEAIAEEDLDSPCGYTCGNYLPMAGGQSSDDGYVDMSPKGRHHATSPTASMSSVTSGTPSTDIRFHDYQLDKVQSFFSDESDWSRPMRAYSVGSRPDHANKAQIDMSAANDSSRTRAFSVGSKTKKIPRILPPHHPHPSIKSSSAPILSSSSRTYSSSHGSLGPMGDLMELDFSKSGRDISGYMDMRPKNNSTPSGYVEMKPGVEVNREISPYVDMSSGNGSSPAKPSYMSSSSSHSSHDDCIVDLNQYKMHQLLSDEPRRRNQTKPSSSPNTTSTYKWPDYMDMSSTAKKSDKNGNSHKLTELSGSNNELSNHQETPEGYVEMTLGKKQHQRQSSLDSAQIRSSTSDDYTNMSVANSKKKREKNRSQPIAIQTTTQNNSCNRHSISNSPKSFSSLLTGSRKFSCGTPPRMHLPLNSSNNVNSNHGQPTSPYSSLPRQRTRSRRDSKDSSSSTVTTPSSSSTIFSLSLNSPSSPNKPSPVAAANPVTNNNSYKLPFMGPVLSMFMNNNNNKENNCGNDDYTMMDFEKKKSLKKDTSEYVNFNPSDKSKTESCSSSSDTEKDTGDYAIMKPGESSNFRPIQEDARKDDSDAGQNGEVSTHPVCPATATSRPSSTSSELCSSSSTLVGSRPESVNSDRIRPASTNSEQLHYASLDLVTDEASGSSPRSNKSPETANSTANQNGPPFSYAQIDFVKTEGLKQQQQQHSLPNAKVKH